SLQTSSHRGDGFKTVARSQIHRLEHRVDRTSKSRTSPTRPPPCGAIIWLHWLVWLLWLVRRTGDGVSSIRALVFATTLGHQSQCSRGDGGLGASLAEDVGSPGP